MTEVERVTIDAILEDLIRAEERIVHLSEDLETYREMVQILLTRLRTEVEYTKRLTYRLEKVNGRG